jgi:hypothetical protein
VEKYRYPNSAAFWESLLDYCAGSNHRNPFTESPHFVDVSFGGCGGGAISIKSAGSQQAKIGKLKKILFLLP